MAAKATFGDYAKQLRIYAKEAPKAPRSYIKNLALAINHTLVMATPIRSGRAKTNWQVGINYPPGGYLLEFPTHPQPGIYLEDVAAQLVNNESIIKGFSSGRIFIINNAPYIGRLNEAYSTQAPAGYIESAIANAKEGIRKHEKGFSSLINEIPVSRPEGGSVIAPILITRPKAVAVAKTAKARKTRR
jgi:hypothetical protein